MMQLLLFALIVATISRTVTQEEIFREFREWVKAKAADRGLFWRKVAYPFSCQYCFSHWVSLVVTAFARFHPLGWVGTIFVLVALANGMMVSYEYATVRVKQRRLEIEGMTYNFERMKEEYVFLGQERGITIEGNPQVGGEERYAQPQRSGVLDSVD